LARLAKKAKVSTLTLIRLETGYDIRNNTLLKIIEKGYGLTLNQAESAGLITFENKFSSAPMEDELTGDDNR
jgi:transcriptional regulator with XRE-family HTH domain